MSLEDQIISSPNGAKEHSPVVKSPEGMQPREMGSNIRSSPNGAAEILLFRRPVGA